MNSFSGSQEISCISERSLSLIFLQEIASFPLHETEDSRLVHPNLFDFHFNITSHLPLVFPIGLFLEPYMCFSSPV
jgi:hypothetical protein